MSPLPSFSPELRAAAPFLCFEFLRPHGRRPGLVISRLLFSLFAFTHLTTSTRTRVSRTRVSRTRVSRTRGASLLDAGLSDAGLGRGRRVPKFARPLRCGRPLPLHPLCPLRQGLRDGRRVSLPPRVLLFLLLRQRVQVHQLATSSSSAAGSSLISRAALPRLTAAATTTMTTMPALRPKKVRTF